MKPAKERYHVKVEVLRMVDTRDLKSLVSTLKDVRVMVHKGKRTQYKNDKTKDYQVRHC